MKAHHSVARLDLLGVARLHMCTNGTNDRTSSRDIGHGHRSHSVI